MSDDACGRDGQASGGRGAAALRRCARCGLPETYETIEFDPEGNVARVFPNVKPAEHDDLVLGALKELA